MKLVRFSTEHYVHTGRIMVGRSSHCTISLKIFAESYISREHFLLDKRMGVWHIIDRSHIGLVKDMVKIKEAQLEVGDIFRFGQLFFCFGEKTAPSPYEITWGAETSNAVVRGVLWPGMNSIGASADNYITIRQGNISRFHGKITVHDDNISFENCNRNIKTTINGALLENNPVSINTGTRIMLADIPIRLQKAERISNDLIIDTNENQLKNISAEEALAIQSRIKTRVPFVVLCLIIFSLGFLTFLMVMLYILFY